MKNIILSLALLLIAHNSFSQLLHDQEANDAESGLIIKNLNDQSIRLWVDSNDTRHIGRGNQSVITIDTDKLVGIGTENPEQKLHVEGRVHFGLHGAGSGAFYQASTGSNWFAGLNSNNAWRIYKDANQFLIDENGNIGIGVDSPEQKLHVEGRVHFGLHESGSGAWYQANSGSNWFTGLNSLNKWRVYKDGNKLIIDENGNVGIGVDNPDSKLVVDGKIHSEEIKVEVIDAPDYVFASGYELRTLQETKKFITKNEHLPEIPSAKEMETSGVDLGEMNMKLLKKIEELTLHLIEQNERIEKMEKDLKKLKR